MFVPIALVVMQVLQPTPPQPEKNADDVLALQVMLTAPASRPARSITTGANTDKALEAFREQRAGPASTGVEPLSHRAEAAPGRS